MVSSQADTPLTSAPSSRAPLTVEGWDSGPWVLRILCTSLITIGPELASVRAPRPGGGGGQALAGAEEGGQVGLGLPTAL